MLNRITFGIVLILIFLAPWPAIAEQTKLELLPVELVEASEDTEPSPTSTEPAPAIPNISTSRPSFTDAVTTVPQGSLQAENGATFTDNRGGTYSWLLPETLLRLGITKNTELRYTVPNDTYLGDRQPGSLANNFGDTSVGLSHHLMAPGKIDVALIPILNLPTGANKISTNSVDPQFRLVGAKNITPKLLVSSMFDVRWNTGKSAPANVVMLPTFISYYSFTPKLTGFLEYAGIIPTEGKTSQFIQSGALYLLAPRHQVDARIAVGLNKTSPNILVGFGYSFRVDGLFAASKAFSSFRR